MGDAEPLAAQDATLWCAGRPGRQMQVGAVCRFAPGPLCGADGRPRTDDLRAHVASRLHLLPRFRQVLVPVPFGAGRPVWVDDASFDVARHVRAADCDGPGGLRGFVAGLFGAPLDPSRPLWELWVLADGGTGGAVVVLRASHVVADGLSMVRAATALLDVVPRPGMPPPPVPWRPRPAPGPAALVVSATADRARARAGLVVAAAASTARAAGDPRGAAAAALALPGVTAGLVRAALRGGPRAPVSGPVGTRRDVVWASVPLGPVRDAAHRAGGTVNDVVLAAVSRALGAVVAPQALVPVGGTDAAGNDFSFLVAGLPAGDAGPGDLVARVHATTAARKASGQAAAVRALFSVVDVVPVALLRRAAPVVLDHQPFVDLAVTDLVGPDVPLFLLGSRLTGAVPVVSGAGNVACVVGVLSYCGDLTVGLTVDPDVVRDPDGLLARLVAALDGLAAAA